MRNPMARGTVIDANRIQTWLNAFASYRQAVNEAKLMDWFQQFKSRDHDVAARTLDAVEFVDSTRTVRVFRAALGRLPGWSRNRARRRGRWRFVAFSKSAGESGDTMLHQFRIANGLTATRYNELFIHRSELAQEKLGPEDSVVFVDDFSGSGNQAVTAWNDFLGELLPECGHMYLILVAVSEKAGQRIGAETGLQLVAGEMLTDADNFFSTRCNKFSRGEKEAMLRYCRRADARRPMGYRDCGFLIVFAHNCPNNSLPVLHVRNRHWTGLFPRHE